MNSSEKSLMISRLGLLLAFTLIVQMAGLPQPVTGPLVNTILFLSTWMFGPVAGLIIGSLTPVIALLRGQLPPLLAPMAPFIIASNIVLVLIFIKLSKRLYGKKILQLVISIFTASLFKMLILYTAVIVIIPLIIGHRLPKPVEWMMSIPQFLTAVTGGVIFMLLISWRPVLFRSVSARTPED